MDRDTVKSFNGKSSFYVTGLDSGQENQNKKQLFFIRILSDVALNKFL